MPKQEKQIVPERHSTTGGGSAQDQAGEQNAVRQTYAGSCHCGAIKLELELDKGAHLHSPRHCGCSFCQRHGLIGISNNQGALHIQIAGQGAVTRYTFGHGTAEFIVCKTCGVCPAVISIIDGNQFGVVNARTLDQPLPFALTDAAPVDFEDEDTENRLRRRQRTWIPNVTISTKDAP